VKKLQHFRVLVWVVDSFATPLANAWIEALEPSITWTFEPRVDVSHSFLEVTHPGLCVCDTLFFSKSLSLFRRA